MNEIIEDRAVRPIPQEKYDLVIWTKYEKLFGKRHKLRNQKLAKISVPFTLALKVKLKRSALGTYLKYFNEGQLQNEFINFNKLAIMETIMKHYGKKKKKLFEFNNNLFDEMMQFLKNTITETEEIDCSFLYENATFLRLDDYSISFVDDGLRDFKNLQILVLSGNWITDIDGSVLPRNLQFLELYANELESVKNLTHKAPKHLLHLGLGRNKLSSDSSLHLLAESGKFKSLKTLDLSECDIYNLTDVLERLSRLQNLETLQLQGNPCSVVRGYKDIILNSFPNLLFLDGTEISLADRDLNDNFLDGADDASLVLYCTELKGLPSTPKADKKSIQTIHVEIVLPLFQEDAKTEFGSNYPTEGDKKKKDNPPSEKKAGGKKSSPYDQENEYNPKIKNNSIVTERKPWAASLNFPPVILKSPENNLFAYRDSFRSRVDVRIVYLKVLVPEIKKEKGKKDKKGGKDKKKGNKKGKDNRSKSSRSVQSSEAGSAAGEIKPIEPKEEILKRVTLAHFHCDLSSLNWKEDGLVFYWTDEPEFGNKAVVYKDYLENLRIEEEKRLQAELEELRKKEALKSSEKTGKAGGKNKNKSASKPSKSKKEKKSKDSKKTSKNVSVSCFVTFDLMRLGKEIKRLKSETKTNKSKGKKKK